MKADELWQAVGRELAAIRLRNGYVSTYAFFTSNRDLSPTVNTLNEIEEGRAKATESLVAYCRALGVLLPDVLRAALNTAPDALSPDAIAIARAYQDNPSDEIRRAVQSILTATARHRVPAPSATPSVEVRAIAADTAQPAQPSRTQKQQGRKRRV